MSGVCQTCFNRRWLPLPWEQLPPEITWATADYYRKREPEKFCKPCPACNHDGQLKFEQVDYMPVHAELQKTYQITNPVFNYHADKVWRHDDQ